MSVARRRGEKVAAEAELAAVGAEDGDEDEDEDEDKDEDEVEK